MVRATARDAAGGAGAAPRYVRVIGYARISSKQQAAGSSLGDQQAAIRAHALALGGKVDRMYVEAESAIHEKSERREQIQALLHDVRRGDLVLVDKLDRWSRDPEFTYASVRKVLEAGASFYAVAERCDPSTPEGDTSLGFRVLFAREEHKRIRERTVGTKRLLRAKGYYVEGQLPYGYRRGRDVPGILEAEPSQVDRITRMFELAASGHSLRDIAGAVGVDRCDVHRRLRSRIYLGEIKSDGRWIRARHEGIVDPRTFALAQRQITGRRNRPVVGGETDDWMLRDVAVCAVCGARMTSAYGGRPADGRPRRYYYRCFAACGVRLVPVRVVEAQVGELVLRQLRSLVHELAEPARPRKRVGVAQRAKRLEDRRDRLVEMYADGVIARAKLDADLARIASDRAALEDEVGPSKTEARAVLLDVRAIERAWKHASGRERRAMVAALASQARLAHDRPPLITWRSIDELKG